jgi:hydroxymethylbilane synthase
MHIRIGTRGSQLALWQSHWVKAQLEALGASVELIEIKTTGDVTQGSLAAMGGQGLFTKEIQRGVLDGRCDLAVHSLKDLPTEPHPDLTLAAVPPREDPRDCLLTREPIQSLADLPFGGLVGTGSPRRVSQLLAIRSDLKTKDIRGNLDTRIQQLDDEKYDAIMLACAGMSRLGLSSRMSLPIPTEQILPAVGQAALGLETRADDQPTLQFVAQLNDSDSAAAVRSERSVLRQLQAGCLSPVAAFGSIDDGNLTLTVRVMSLDGRQRIESCHAGLVENWSAVADRVFLDLCSNNAPALIADTRR